jgi:hypothetical protein
MIYFNADLMKESRGTSLRLPQFEATLFRQRVRGLTPPSPDLIAQSNLPRFTRPPGPSLLFANGDQNISPMNIRARGVQFRLQGNAAPRVAAQKSCLEKVIGAKEHRYVSFMDGTYLLLIG